MARNENLPFARGDTLFGINGSESITSAQADSFAALLGKEYVVEDPDYGGEAVTLKVCQYNGTGSLTADARCVDFDTSVDPLNRVFVDLAPGANTLALPLDHKYEGLTIRDLDYCYVIAKGPCECEFIEQRTVLDPVQTDTAGKIAAVGAGSNFILGYAVDAGTTNTNATIMVQPHVGIE